MDISTSESGTTRADVSYLWKDLKVSSTQLCHDQFGREPCDSDIATQNLFATLSAMR